MCFSHMGMGMFYPDSGYYIAPIEEPGNELKVTRFHAKLL